MPIHTVDYEPFKKKQLAFQGDRMISAGVGRPAWNFAQKKAKHRSYRGTSLIRNRLPP